ncbi:cation acetate symporter, partial [Morganella morganii]|nr:cation acetate symporter [Morganella morganii]
LLTAVSLIVLGPILWVNIVRHEKVIYPYGYPALFSMFAAFIAVWLVSVTDNSAQSREDRSRFAAQFIRSQRGIGIEQGKSH